MAQLDHPAGGGLRCLQQVGAGEGVNLGGCSLQSSGRNRERDLRVVPVPGPSGVGSVATGPGPGGGGHR